MRNRVWPQRERALHFQVMPGGRRGGEPSPERRARLQLVAKQPRDVSKRDIRMLIRTGMLGAASWVLPVCGWLR